jgi:hypothetical protein
VALEQGPEQKRAKAHRNARLLRKCGHFVVSLVSTDEFFSTWRSRLARFLDFFQLGEVAHVGNARRTNVENSWFSRETFLLILFSGNARDYAPF